MGIYLGRSLGESRTRNLPIMRSLPAQPAYWIRLSLAGLTEQHDRSDGDAWPSSAMTSTAAPNGVVVSHLPTNSNTPDADSTMIIVVIPAAPA